MKQQLEEGDPIIALAGRKLNGVRYGDKGKIYKAYCNNQYDVEFEGNENHCIYMRDELEFAGVDQAASAAVSTVLQKSDFSQGIVAPVAEEIELPILNA